MNGSPRLSRTVVPLPAAPVRIVHLGLGAFHRAHQAWYTTHAHDAADWGIAAFTGRRPHAAAVLAEQDGLYTLIERGPERDRDEVVGSLVEAADGADTARLVDLLSRPRVAVVTLTVTEAGYRSRPDGDPDLDDDGLAADVAALRAAIRAGAPLGVLAPTTTIGRLLAGLEGRRRAGAGPLAVVPCDNIPANGDLARRGVLGAGRAVDDVLAAYVAEAVAYVSTSVDRITPRTTDADVAAFNAHARWRDAAPVITEPFSDWVLSGAFPAGRPAWEDAGARFVDDIEPWERRKLWLLNGAHTLLALAGPPRGHATVASAVRDPVLRSAVERFWDEAARHLPASLDVERYRRSLLERFDNPRIEHRLAQIAEDSERKVRLRVAPVAEAELAAGRPASACAFVVAALLDAADRPPAGAPESVLADVSPALARDAGFVAEVAGLRRS
ncbi:mannitol dehydrogenase family protein [Amnibacterium sp. CER49]|uniref:mannitol dehydrogenase family protein n=1 Tax=Amnibacterium sp. CER49 TaxID=3039161 RepID=UPI00244A5B00|nr:mannitol dehydrogenase family protein [Amnibacterium sp. CER49]MDH2443352.1 mannitol dehydrogenase family protein [Amnibacterium sp. CER49]